MKIISNPFYRDETSLLQLLEASMTKEIIIYDGIQCTVCVEPGITAQELGFLARRSTSILVDGFDQDTHYKESLIKNGCFHSVKLKTTSLDESYRMRICVDKKTVVKRVEMTIKSSNTPNAVVEKKRCVVQ